MTGLPREMGLRDCRLVFQGVGRNAVIHRAPAREDFKRSHVARLIPDERADSLGLSLASRS